MRCSTATCSSITSSVMEPFWRHLDAEISRGLKLRAADNACQSCADTHSCTPGKRTDSPDSSMSIFSMRCRPPTGRSGLSDTALVVDYVHERWGTCLAEFWRICYVL